MAEEAFIKRPTSVYRTWLLSMAAPEGFREGQLAMAMEIITVRKSLQAVGIIAESAASMLDSLLLDQDLLDEAEELYEMLNEWRLTKFTAVDASHVAVPRPRRTPGLGTPTLPRRDRTIPPSDEPEG